MDTMSAAELLKRLADGQRIFNRITVTDDFVWDAATRGSLHITGSLHMCEMLFEGKCHFGDLSVTDTFFLGGSTFDQRCALYQVNAPAFSANGAVFSHGLGIVNSKLDVADLMNAHFPGDIQTPPCGLLIKKTSGQLLRLDKARSPGTVIVESDFGKISEVDAELGRRTSVTLDEIMAA